MILTNITEAAAYLLECTLATYDQLCSLSHKPKSELDRHEKIVTTAFPAIHDAYQGCAGVKGCPRTTEILSYVFDGDSIPEACHRYFNKVRFGVGK